MEVCKNGGWGDQDNGYKKLVVNWPFGMSKEKVKL